MTHARRSHEQKSFAERQRYFETTVRGKFGPTVDESEARTDSTETTIASALETTRAYRRPTRPKKRNRYTNFAREHWVKILAGLVSTAIVGLLAWALIQVYALNREVGQLQAKVQATADEQSGAKADLQRFEDRMTHELDRLNDRLDHYHK